VAVDDKSERETHFTLIHPLQLQSIEQSGIEKLNKKLLALEFD